MTQAEMDSRIKSVQQHAAKHVKSGTAGIPNLSFCDMVLFIGLKYLLVAYKNSLATREEISTEKKKLLASYKIALIDEDMYQSQAKLRNRISSKLVELEKCGCEHCRELIRIFDGRQR